MKNEIVIFDDQKIKLEVNVVDETVWLNVDQMSKLFGKAKSTIREHILNIYNDNELEESNTLRKIGNSDFSTKPTNYYNLDMIISVGYKVNSKKGILFRRWANNILKEHLLRGYTINQKRLDYLEKKVQLINIAGRINQDLTADEAQDIIKVISSYDKALDLLDDYDHKRMSKPKGNTNNIKITYSECIKIINELKFNNNSTLFGLEKDKGLESIINNIYQTFSGKDLYESNEEKAANFLYLITKNHTFIDGNKRIAAALFIFFLDKYNILYKNYNKVIENNTLVALTLLVAESNPKEKEILIDLIMNFLINT